MTSQQKIECLGKLIPKTAASTGNGKHQLLIPHSASATRARGANVVPIFATHFVQSRFKQARLSCGLNSCIILNFIFLGMAQAQATYGEIEEVWFGGYGSVPFGPFA